MAASFQASATLDASYLTYLNYLNLTGLSTKYAGAMILAPHCPTHEL